MSWNPPVDRNQTRICQACGLTFKPTNVDQTMHQTCAFCVRCHTTRVPNVGDYCHECTWDSVNESLARGFE